MYAGNPARKFAQLDDAKHALTALIVMQYCQYAQEFEALEQEHRVQPQPLGSRRSACDPPIDSL